MPNIAPHSSKNFSKHRNFHRQDVIFGPPGAHLISKWTKTMQNAISHHQEQVPVSFGAFKALLRSRNLSPQGPLFASIRPPHKPILIHTLGMLLGTFLYTGTLPQLLKWTNTMQDRKAYQLIQFPTIMNKHLCPGEALKALRRSKNLSPQGPLFASIRPPHKLITDTHIRGTLKHILAHRNISPASHGFHTFIRSWATFAFDHSVPLQNIMSYGLWKCSAVDLPPERLSSPFSCPFHIFSLHSLFLLVWLGVSKLP